MLKLVKTVKTASVLPTKAQSLPTSYYQVIEKHMFAKYVRLLLDRWHKAVSVFLTFWHIMNLAIPKNFNSHGDTSTFIMIHGKTTTTTQTGIMR